MKINDPIPYKFPFDWSSGVGQKSPVVNTLLKYIIEGNVSAMEEAFRRGASINAVDYTTLKIVLYQVITGYDNCFAIIKCLLAHGFTPLKNRNGISSKFVDECFTLGGYSSGLFAAAYYHKDYQLAYLLAENGFCDSLYPIRKSNYSSAYIHIIDYIVKKEDWTTVNFLLAHSYPIMEFCDAIYDSIWGEAKRYIYHSFQVKRVSFMLDPCKYKRIPYPEFSKVTFWGRKEIKKYNQELLADYEDRCKAQKEFAKKYYGMNAWEKICEYEFKNALVF